MDNNKLRPCPFCGGTTKISSRYIGYGSIGLGSHDLFYVECESCRAKSDEGREIEHVKTLWNKRTRGKNVTEYEQAELEGRLLIFPKDTHQPYFIKQDALSMFDEWNNATGVIAKGTSHYHEIQAVIESIAAMSFGAGIFYEAERKAEE